MARVIGLSDQFFYSLTHWHAIAFGVVFIFVILFLAGAIYMAYRPKTSLILQMASLAMLTAGPLGAYWLVESLYKPALMENVTIQHLYYQDKALLRGEVLNIAGHTLYGCVLKAKGYEPPTGTIDYIIKLAKPLSQGDRVLDYPIPPQMRHPFEIELPGVAYDQNISVSINLRCR